MQDLALFPLNVVLCPGGRLPLRIFEQRYMEMAKACLRDSAPFGVCLIREGAEVGRPATPAAIGCLARIAEWDMPQLGLLQVTSRGACRPTAWRALPSKFFPRTKMRRYRRTARAACTCSSG